ncbi:hypothetical protein ACFFUS_00075 [Vibrio gallaecicus]|uniref:hypothetical protein n=1 Tax=Vibrio gallaecicus TaxID=552386 RepID=UPI001F0FE820|nr:hypothetical protein [Vibrio gallaecicus]MDN3617215.1 hypothetical protein [Vibrio gallaecicus]
MKTKLTAFEQELKATNNKLEAGLQKSIAISQIQFEKEYLIYGEIWEALVSLKIATDGLRPIMDYVDPKQSEDERKQERMTQFIDPFNSFSLLLQTHKPFYSSSVYEALSNVRTKCHHESVDFDVGKKNDPDYYKEAVANSREISSLIDDACTAIQERLESVKVL